MTTVYERLKALQITLPDVPVPVVEGYDAAFVPFVRTGNLVYLSGRLAKKDGKPWSGKMGEQITTLEGKQAARGCQRRVRTFPGNLWRAWSACAQHVWLGADSIRGVCGDRPGRRPERHMMETIRFINPVAPRLGDSHERGFRERRA